MNYQPIKMNNLSLLPFELYPFIFNRLSLKDLVKLRRVCKRLSLIVNECGIKELILSFKSTNYKIEDNYLNRWYYDNKYINEDRSIRVNINQKLRTESFKKAMTNDENLIKNIKKLKLIIIIKDQNKDILFTYLTEFTKLEQLDIHLNMNQTFHEFNYIITHGNLKRLYVNRSFRAVLGLNCPNLEVLAVTPNFKVNYSNLNYDKIIHLGGTYCADKLDLSNFKNLESIEVISTYIRESQVNKLPRINNLKRINFNSIPIKNDLINLLSMKESLKRDDLIISIKHDKILNLTELEQYYEENCSDEDSYYYYY